MSGLNGFFRQNAAQVDNIKMTVSQRFSDENREPLLWEVRCIPSVEDEELRRESIRRVPVPGKQGQFTGEVDIDIYLGKLAAKCTVFPNLNDKELQDSYGVMGNDILLKTMLTPGEYGEYLLAVQKLNGFDVTLDDAVDQAKN